MSTHYQIFVEINGKWELAHEGNMRKSAAEGMFSQFAQQYNVRMFRGFNVGKLVKESKIVRR